MNAHINTSVVIMVTFVLILLEATNVFVQLEYLTTEVKFFHRAIFSVKTMV